MSSKSSLYTGPLARFYRLMISATADVQVTHPRASSHVPACRCSPSIAGSGPEDEPIRGRVAHCGNGWSATTRRVPASPTHVYAAMSTRRQCVLNQIRPDAAISEARRSLPFSPFSSPRNCMTDERLLRDLQTRDLRKPRRRASQNSRVE